MEGVVEAALQVAPRIVSLLVVIVVVRTGASQAVTVAVNPPVT